MSACPIRSEEGLAYLLGDLEEGRRTTVAEHLQACPDCRKEMAELRRVLEGADAVRDEIQEALRSVDWEALPGRVADYVYAHAERPEKAAAVSRARSWFLQAGLRPVAAGVALGLLVGALGMYLALRRPSLGPGRDQAYFASREYLDRVELEMARRETVSYLEKSQYVLLDVLGGASASPRPGLSAAQARELLSRKKYLNPQLEKFRMAKAKVLCDQIEVLFLELAQVSDELPEAELAKIRDLVLDRQLFLKINIVKKELQNGV
jgi:Putative zinc-finger